MNKNLNEHLIESEEKEHLVGMEIESDEQSIKTEIDDRPDEEKQKLSFIVERIERFKRLYFKLTRGSISGSVFCLLCMTFGSGKLD